LGLSRRSFIKWGALAGAGLTTGWYWTRRFLGGATGPDALSRASPTDLNSPRGKSAFKLSELVEAMHYEKLPNQAVRCNLCFRQCVIGHEKRGFCENRENREGTFYSLVFNRPCSLEIDPVEKEPLYHFFPGTTIFCLSTASCNYRCRFCHNWTISYRAPEEVFYEELSASDIVRQAKERGCPTISHTYAEPTVHYEYLLAVGKEARKQKLNFIYHTNLGIMPEPLKEILPTVSALSIDLKGFTQDYYQRMCNADLNWVLENLKIVREAGVYFELINLVLPTQNDDPKDIEKMCLWIKDNLGPDTPLHFSRFVPTQRFRELPYTPIETLDRCHSIARKAGLSFVYVGNVPGHAANSTYCPDCGKPLIRRYHFEVLENLVKDGQCPHCKRKLPGVWA
jgi:pyruvate formate lyase activating enzyme